MSAAYNEKQKKLVLPEFEYFFFSLGFRSSKGDWQIKPIPSFPPSDNFCPSESFFFSVFVSFLRCHRACCPDSMKFAHSLILNAVPDWIDQYVE